LRSNIFVHSVRQKGLPTFFFLRTAIKIANCTVLAEVTAKNCEGLFSIVLCRSQHSVQWLFLCMTLCLCVSSLKCSSLTSTLRPPALTRHSPLHSGCLASIVNQFSSLSRSVFLTVTSHYPSNSIIATERMTFRVILDIIMF